MMLTFMGTLAQNEVESTSKNVKMGIKMKMKRGELMGFNGCLGYDYHLEDKTITVNEAEAETVRLIFELYLQGYGTYTITRRLTELGRINKKGQVKWTDSGVRGIIKNEKYKGDLLLQKTITTDPISKRRIENFGEEEQYYVRDHHEPIVSREVWEQAKEIRLSRNRQSKKMAVESGRSTQRNMHSPVCASVASAVRSLQGAPFTAVLNMKLRSGIAEMLLIKESITVQTVSRCMSLSWRMHFLRHISC